MTALVLRQGGTGRKGSITLLARVRSLAGVDTFMVTERHEVVETFPACLTLAIGIWKEYGVSIGCLTQYGNL